MSALDSHSDAQSLSDYRATITAKMLIANLSAKQFFADLKLITHVYRAHSINETEKTSA